ncbi:MAG: TetR/AcrR family transcriptional regulator [Mycobacterium sp.]
MAQTRIAEPPSTRPYRGVDAADRLAKRRDKLLVAGLDILGGDPVGENGTDLTSVTVRGVCARAGLAARYFYESFTDKDAFVGSVFDWIITDLATTTQAAVAATPPQEQTRAGMANIVAAIVNDARIGRLLFSAHLTDPVLVRKRQESGALFAMLSGQHLGNAFQIKQNDRIRATARFAVGGVAQTISAWLAGEFTMSPERLVDQLAALLDQLGDPRLHRG